MERIEHEGIVLELNRGDIANQPDIDAVVNAANAQLRTGGGVAGAIHRAAGPGLTEETRPLAPINPGEAVITGGHNLPNDHVIHTLGPVYGRDNPEEELLTNCYHHSLDRAEEQELSSIAFPAISTGAFGYPEDDASRVALQAVKDRMSDLQHVEIIRFVLFGQDSYDTHVEALEEIFS